MTTTLPSSEEILQAIRTSAKALGRPPSRREFKSHSGMTEYQVLKHFPSWREAVRAAGLEPNSTNQPLDPAVLLEDWGEYVRKYRRIPTRNQYRSEGTYSAGVFDRKIGTWSSIPSKFRAFAEGRPEWADVVALLPIEVARPRSGAVFSMTPSTTVTSPSISSQHKRHAKLDARPTYGNPIDFRGLRHEPVNEDGVVFLFGMVARELGYLVEAVQAGFPDCEAKRQVDAGKWQRVRIEFEFESKAFRDHGHSLEGCDVIVCWKHNWPDCPPHLEVVELSNVIKYLSASDD
ncbi:MAG: hypothetical protein NTX71_02810 [Candidatus Aureabacteria bacterium]|nr:hypothetical protein [Candidatus Auribacterota bacterium]